MTEQEALWWLRKVIRDVAENSNTVVPYAEQASEVLKALKLTPALAVGLMEGTHVVTPKPIGAELLAEIFGKYP